jgi:hypothetical protein
MFLALKRQAIVMMSLRDSMRATTVAFNTSNSQITAQRQIPRAAANQESQRDSVLKPWVASTLGKPPNASIQRQRCCVQDHPSSA